MINKKIAYRRELLNQLINFFWTIVAFIPVLIFWIRTGVDLYFYLAIATSLIMAVLPAQVLHLLMLSDDRRIYERLGVRYIRKYVQNGDTVKAMSNGQTHFVINGAAQAKAYLKTIAMYERFHWICLIFFLFTTILSFCNGFFIVGSLTIIANILYNVCSILLQQYNKVRIGKIVAKRPF